MNATHANDASPALSPKHFDLLRIAKLRGLKARRIGEYVFAVPSHTHKADGLEWVVTLSASGAPLQSVTCSCPAKGYCTHLAAAVDYYFINDAPVGDFTEYRKADISDRTQLRMRIRSGELTRNDKIYVRFCVWFYERKRKAAQLGTSIRKVESIERGRVKVREYVGGIQI